LNIHELYADETPIAYIFEIENISNVNSGDLELTVNWDEEDFTFNGGDQIFDDNLNRWVPGKEFSNIRPGQKGEIRLTLLLFRFLH